MGTPGQVGISRRGSKGSLEDPCIRALKILQKLGLGFVGSGVVQRRPPRVRFRTLALRFAKEC